MADFILSRVAKLAMSRAESQLEKSKFNKGIKVQECDANADAHCFLARTIIYNAGKTYNNKPTTVNPFLETTIYQRVLHHQ